MSRAPQWIKTWGIGLLIAACAQVEANPRLDFALAVLAKSRGDEKAEVEHLEKARMADPLALSIVRYAAMNRLDSGDRAGAVKLHRDLAQARPDDLGVQLEYSDLLEREGGGDALAAKLSIDALESALAKHPRNIAVIERLFRLHRARGNTGRSLELLEQLSPDDPAAVLLLATLTRSITDAADSVAREKLDRRMLAAFEINPDDPDLARATSDQFNSTKRIEEAIRVLERHVEVAPSSLDLRTRLGILYFSAKRNKEGEAALADVLQINPNQWLAHQALAKYHRSGGRADPARFHASELLKLRGGPSSEFLALADEWLAANDPKAARLLLEKAVFDHPDHLKLRMKLAIATRRDPETAESAGLLFREVEAVVPAGEELEPMFLMESAESLLLQGQSAPAEERMRRAIRGFPPDAKTEAAAALRRLASVWESENRNVDAARSLRQRADSLDPK